MSDHLPALFRLGDEGDGVLAIRERLQRTGDLPAGEGVGGAGDGSPAGVLAARTRRVGPARTTRPGTTTRCAARCAPSSSVAG